VRARIDETAIIDSTGIFWMEFLRRRREFIALLGGAAAVWPLAARAQHPERKRRIGVLMAHAENDAEFHDYLSAFREGLQKQGWTEGRNIQIDSRWGALDDAEARQRSAKELIAYSLT
jgi:hypothetical protein